MKKTGTTLPSFKILPAKSRRWGGKARAHWLAHHRLRLIVSIGLSLEFVLFVVGCLPAAFHNRDWRSRDAYSCFSVVRRNLVAVSMESDFHVRRPKTSGLFHTGGSEAELRALRRRGILTFVLFVLSIDVAFWMTLGAQITWIAGSRWGLSGRWSGRRCKHS